MANAIALHSSVDEDFRKCGEIIRTTREGNKFFQFRCFYCPLIYMQLGNFILHIEEQHEDELCMQLDVEDANKNNDETKKFVVEEGNEIVNECFVIEKQPLSIENGTEDINFAQIDEQNEVKAIDFHDPLEESEADCEEEDLKESSKFVDITDECNEDEHDREQEEEIEMTDYEEVPNNNNDSISNNTDNSDTQTDTESDMEQDDDDDDDDEAVQNSKEITLAIIEEYEKCPLLWDANEQMFKNRKKRDEAFKRITKSINKQFEVKLKMKNICERIRKLRYKFRAELINQKQAEMCEANYAPQLWCYDNMRFLNTSIEYKQRKKRGTKALSNEKPALPLANLSDAQNIELIDIYKSYPCLWDDQHIGFRFKNQRQEALAEMLHTIETKMSFRWTQDEIQKKIYRIRYACTQQKHLRLQCERLDEKFHATCKFYEQLRFLEANVGPFKCPFCEETFNGADRYKIHKSKHDGSMPFTCPLCQRGFMKVGNCTVHLRRHTRDYPFECKVCKKRYATTTDVNVHMRYHTGEKPYFCEVCGQSFRTWTFFDAHMRRHQKRPTHKCSICSKAFYENNKLSEHMKAHLNVRDKVCNVCGKAFTSSKYLRQHKQIHAEKKKYACKICGKDFAQYAGLSGHMKSHGTTVSGTAVINEENH